MNNGNALGVLAGNIVAGNRTLHAVQTNGAEDQLIAALGNFRAGGSRGHHQDAFILVDVGGGLGGAGAQVAHHETNAVVDQAVGYGDRLLRVTDVVVFDGNQFFAHHTAVGVDLLDGHAGTGELHVTVLGDGAGHRAGNTDLDLCCCLAGGHQCNGSAYSACEFLY